MTPNPGTDEADADIKSEGKESPKSTEQSSKTSSKAAAKRRTKTGCLTCRKRRIKCGEEKPFCKNCIKSKRECAGYVQPLVYKQQQGLSAQDPGSRSSLSDGEFQFNDGFGTSSHAPASHFGPFNPFLSLQNHLGQESRDHNVASQAQSFQYPAPDPGNPYPPPPSAYSLETFRRHSFQDHNAHLLGFGASGQLYTTGHESTWAGRPLPSPLAAQPFITYDTFGLPTTMITSPGAYSESYAGVSSNHFPFDATPLHEPSTRRYSVHGFVQVAPLDPNIPTLEIPDGFNEDVEDPDDPFDVDMDDEPEHVALDQVFLQDSTEARKRHTLKTGLVGQPARLRQRGAVRTMGQPSPISPLLDDRNERVFKHFVDILAPCMSIFERPPLDPWASPPRTLWSYTLPSAAMSNPALAHAMLAISSLHIAKLQQSSESLSLKHFTNAARRVGRLLSLPQRRHEVTTLATVLVLGFYEVLGADHSRWNLHLAGATKLVTEHDLASLTYRARRSRTRAQQVVASYSNQAFLTEASYVELAIAPSLLDDVAWDVDQKMISDFTGLAVNYDTPVNPTMGETDPSQPMMEPEVATYKTKMDLWWWFCKQDMFQSLVSGERLLMPYHLRKHCPPRGRIGIAEAHYATFDHLVLLLSRLADFGGKDRHRKQRAIHAQGGQWRPPPWLFSGQPSSGGSSSLSKGAANVPVQQSQASRTTSAPAGNDQTPFQRQRAPSANEGRVRQSKPHLTAGIPQERPSMPPMFGMMPPPPVPPKMHSSFHSMDRSLRTGGAAPLPEDLRHSPPRLDLEDETRAAFAEHEAISKGFDLFYASLGPGLQPIPNDGTQPSSPFGPRLRYSGPEIACIWALYNVGKILLKRLHPDMPPAAMVAAGVTAHLTTTYAQAIGQICAGLFASIPAGNLGEPLSPRFAGALMEVTFPILFSGIQYTDISQRGWLISKLHDIAQMTGWSTSAAVAAACEISWEKMGQAGKGPPYIRSLDRNNKDVRVNGHLRRLAPQLASAMTDVESEHESQFVSHDRSLISKSGPSRVHWAMGLLSVEEDVRKMNIGQE